MWKWLFGEKTYTSAEVLQTLRWCRYTSNNDFTVKLITDLIITYPDIHKQFLASFEQGEIMESNVDLIKKLMNTWPEDLAPVMTNLLKCKNVAAGMAIGTEKSTYSESYYHLVRNLIQMTSHDFRRYCVEIRKMWDVVARTYTTTKPYSICLFNEPLNFKIDHRHIYTYYKNTLKSYDYVYDPVEINNSSPLLDVYPVVKNIKNKPIVVICNSVGPGITPPEGVWIVFTESTKSFGPRIVPFFMEKGHSVLKNFLDFVEFSE